MSWTAPSRPSWVEAVNRGSVPIIDGTRPIDAGLLADAVVGMGRDPESTPLHLIDRDAAAIFLGGLEASAALTPLGRWATRRYLHRLVEVGVQIDDWTEQDPEVAGEVIAEPIFVLGPPRSGTTALHRLLAALPGHRAPLGWELARPVPPPRWATHDVDPRIESTRLELAFPQQVVGELTTMHRYSATMPKECLSAMAVAWCSEELISRYDVPEYAANHFAVSRAPGYRAHKRVLQILQRRLPTAQWVLKSPVHLHSLPTLRSVYPEARFVVTHRHPQDFLASVSSLICTLRSAFSDTVDAIAVGRYHLELYRRGLDALVDAADTGVLPPDRTVHVHHADVVDDAVRAVSVVAETFGRPITTTELAELQSTQSTPRTDGVGSHRYDPADFGLADVDFEASFGRYLERFDVRR